MLFLASLSLSPTTTLFFLLLLLQAKGVKKMKNENRILVDRKWMMNLEVFEEVEKVDSEGVVRKYNKCLRIDEGLLG